MHFVNTHDLARLARVSRVCGFDIDQLLTAVGIAASESAGPDVLWEWDALERLYTVGIELSTKAHFPFVLGELFMFDRAPEVDAFVATSATLREAMSIHSYVPYLVQPNTISWQDENDVQMHIHVDMQRDGELLINPGHIETIFVSALHLMKQVTPDLKIDEITFRHHPLRPISEYEIQFGMAPQFGVGSNRISLPVEIVDHHLENSSPMLHAQAQLLLEARIKKLIARSGLERTIEVMVIQSPEATMMEICERLGVEQRSLQRRLQEEGTSFNSLHAKARFHLARVLLSDQDLDIESIAVKLGFADRNGFTKAFTKWAGMPPSQYRHTQRFEPT